MGPAAALLPCGTRLHLQHGPIDLIVTIEGPGRELAEAAAAARFRTVLEAMMDPEMHRHFAAFKEGGA